MPCCLVFWCLFARCVDLVGCFGLRFYGVLCEFVSVVSTVVGSVWMVVLRIRLFRFGLPLVSGLSWLFG